LVFKKQVVPNRARGRQIVLAVFPPATTEMRENAGFTACFSSFLSIVSATIAFLNLIVVNNRDISLTKRFKYIFSGQKKQQMTQSHIRTLDHYHFCFTVCCCVR
jgi:hypothetical protein